MSGGLIETKSLIDETTDVASETLLGSIERVVALMSKERRMGPLRVEGRLAHLPPSGKAVIVGDLHGDLESLTYILENSGFLREVQEGKSVYLVFLGDYGDRGSASLEVYYVVLRLIEMFPKNVIVMRGNHEGPRDMLPIPHDLPIQLEKKYGEETGEKVYTELRRLFNCFYSAVIVDERVVMIHGGFPSEASSLEDIAYAHRKHPRESHLEEMLWNDPKDKIAGVQPSPRGAGRLFGADITEKFLRMLGVKILIRSHEACREGYKLNHNGKILTLFSTAKPSYHNEHRAYLQLDLSRKIKDAEQLKLCVKQF